ncbi:thiamine-monophosphate kinase [Nocardiopsis mwathae]|uniref:Thiamine-monophosphate kinase n=1 Tax=Nocardiopsis mwathae TaxID=1472723 RepID=A0A7W9YJ17_9ACTN|nr:thiamine-monophosphate kinase [Nocardiopsis mwathae]
MASTIGDLGEFGLIERVTARFPRTDDVILGPGDDAAVVRAPDRRVVASTDMLVEGRHFRRDWSTPRDIGHKAVAQNFADVAAMGARPTTLLIGLGVPADLAVDWADEFAAGVAAECATAGGTVVGGDTVRSDTVVVSVTALGDLGGRAEVRRDGARPGDVVAVAGRLGLSAAGLALLDRGLDAPEACLREHRRPRPPYAEGPRAALLGATAMLDVSDGLVQDLGHLCAASGVTIDLERAALVPPPELRAAAAALAGERSADATALMLAGGEDHALAATFPPGTELPDAWTRIGTVAPRSAEADAAAAPAVTVDGRPTDAAGWRHFG